MRRLKLGFAILGLALFCALAVWFFAHDPTARRAERLAERPPPAETPRAPSDPDAPILDDPEQPPAEWPADAPRLVWGTITNPAGDPVVGASVRLVVAGESDRVVFADSRGQYRLERVPARPTALEVGAAGYQPTVFEKPRLPREPKVQWDVELEPVEGVYGVIVANGRPVPDAWVSLRPKGQQRRILHGRADRGGRFALAWPEEDGVYTLAAFSSMHGRKEIDVSEPGEVTVELPGGGYLQGRVIDTDGRPVPSFSLSAGPMTFRAGGPPAQSFDNANGHFRLGPMAAGRTQLWAVAEGYQPGEVKSVVVEEGLVTSGIVVRLEPSTYLTGTVTDAQTGRPVVGALVLPAEWRAAALAEAVGGYTDEQGRYRLTALPGQRTSIKVSANGYRPLVVGGVEGAADGEAVRDFSLMPQPEGERPATELTGIGAVLRPHREGVMLGSIVEGGPASARLRRGDVIVMVDGESVRNDVGKAAQAIRGEIGSDVVLWVKRGGRGEPQRVVITRDRVTMPNPHAPRN